MRGAVMKNIRYFLLIVLILSNGAVALAYYHPDEGRWIARDPIGELGFELTSYFSTGEEGDNNLYRFVNNNPVVYWDILGLYIPGSSAIWDCDTSATTLCVCIDKCKKSCTRYIASRCSCNDANNTLWTSWYNGTDTYHYSPFSITCCSKPVGYWWVEEWPHSIRKWTENADCKCQPGPNQP